MGLLGQTEIATPTTILGAFIVLAVAMNALIVWITRTMMAETIPKLQDLVAKSGDTANSIVGKVTDASDKTQERWVEFASKQFAFERESCERRDNRTIDQHLRQHAENMEVLRAIHSSLESNRVASAAVAKIMTHRTRMADVFRSTADAIYAKTPSGIITAWNEAAERLLGWTSGEIVGRSAAVLIPPDLQGEEENILDKINRGMIVDPYRTERLCKDGRLVPVQVRVSPIKDPQGKVVGASAILREV